MATESHALATAVVPSGKGPEALLGDEFNAPFAVACASETVSRRTFLPQVVLRKQPQKRRTQRTVGQMQRERAPGKRSVSEFLGGPVRGHHKADSSIL